MSRSRHTVAEFNDLPLMRQSNSICRCALPGLPLSSIILPFENLILKENNGSPGRSRRNLSLLQIVCDQERTKTSKDTWNTSRLTFFFQQNQNMFIFFISYIPLFTYSSNQRTVCYWNWDLPKGLTYYFKWSFKRQKRAPGNQERPTKLDNHNSWQKCPIVLYCELNCTNAFLFFFLFI